MHVCEVIHNKIMSTYICKRSDFNIRSMPLLQEVIKRFLNHFYLLCTELLYGTYVCNYVKFMVFTIFELNLV